MVDKNIKRQIVEYARLMDEKGMGNSYEGNISVRKDGLIYITPTHKRKSTLKKGMVAVIDMNGAQIDGISKPSSELPMHKAAYESRKDIGAVIHSHTPYLTAYAMCHKPIETYISHEMIAIFKKIPVAPYGRAGTDKIYEGAKELIKTYDCVLLANHGSLLVAENLDMAFARLESAESLAHIFSIAQTIGKPVNIPQEEIEYWSKIKIRD